MILFMNARTINYRNQEIEYKINERTSEYDENQAMFQSFDEF